MKLHVANLTHNRAIWGILGLTFVIPILALGFIYYLYGSIQLGPSTSGSGTGVEASEVTMQIYNDPLSVLLLGYGGGEHDGGKLTDTMILAYINPNAQRVSLLSIPRDLWLPLPISDKIAVDYKINAAYAIGSDDEHFKNKSELYSGIHGGGNLAKEAVFEVTGIRPDYYIAVSFDGFIKALEALGPLTVDVPQAFTDNYYPIEGKETDPCGYSEAEIQQLMTRYKDFELEKQFGCRYESISFDKGEQTMDARRALSFVRSRHSAQNGTDFGRSERQQALLEAARSKVVTLDFIANLIPFLKKLPGLVDTDVDLAAARQFYGYWQQMKEMQFQSFQLDTTNVLAQSISPNRAYILIPKEGIDHWSLIHSYVEQQVFTASASAEIVQ